MLCALFCCGNLLLHAAGNVAYNPGRSQGRDNIALILIKPLSRRFFSQEASDHWPSQSTK